jgi:hypothetical protein
MRYGGSLNLRYPLLLTVILYLILAQASTMLYAQSSGGGGTANTGAAPVLGKAVQGQNAAQPEGTMLNLVNWIGNVIAPLGAVLCVVMAVVAYTQGRGVARWAVTAVGLLMISGLTRLIESWIVNGTNGVQ